MQKSFCEILVLNGNNTSKLLCRILVSYMLVIVVNRRGCEIMIGENIQHALQRVGENVLVSGTKILAGVVLNQCFSNVL
jgi:hypothetical protein